MDLALTHEINEASSQQSPAWHLQVPRPPDKIRIARDDALNQQRAAGKCPSFRQVPLTSACSLHSRDLWRITHPSP